MGNLINEIFEKNEREGGEEQKNELKI